MARYEEDPSGKGIYRLEWIPDNRDEAPPPYSLEEQSSSSNISSPPTVHAHATNHSFGGSRPEAETNAYTLPARPSSPPQQQQPLPSRPAYRDNEHIRSSSPSCSVYASPSAPTAHPAAQRPSQYAYAASPYGTNGLRAGSSRSPVPAPQLRSGLGGLARGVMGMPTSSTNGGSRPSTSEAPDGDKTRFVDVIMRAVDGPRDVLNSPPPSFSRAPHPQLPYTPFPPLVVVGLDRSIGRGFPPVLPPSQVQPHPFVLHDVHKEDWMRFLSDIQTAAGSVVSATGQDGGLIRMLVGKGLETALGGSKKASVAQVVEHWNTYFFHSRLMEVNFVRGRRVYTNSGRLPPEMVQQGYSRDNHERDNRDDPWQLIITYRQIAPV